MNHPGGGMVTMNTGAGGPVGAAPMINNAAARQQQNMLDQEKLNTYIYDYLCKSQHWDIARLFLKKCQVKTTLTKPASPGRMDDMDTDSKDEKRPEDLPYPSIPDHPSENAFLYDWWCQFWDIFAASRDPSRRTNPTNSADNYLHYNQNTTRARQIAQQQMLQRTERDAMMRQYGQGPMAGTQPNGMTNLQRTAMQNNNKNPQAMQMQQKLIANQMQRDGSMGDNRGQSPNSMENMGSPSKRPRTDGGNFNGQQGPAGRGQTMPSQQMGNMPGGGQNGMMLQNGLPNDMNQQQMNAFSAATPNSQQKSMEAMNANGGQQGAMGQQGMDGQMDFMNQQRIANGGQNTSQGNHALQDYQMQLMLLEQQNKKRLLMARQEQDNINHVPAGSGPGAFAPALSPSGSRAGPSPNPNEQMKRVAGTPKMGPGVIPGGSPMPEMPNRNSPAPGSLDAPQAVRGQYSQWNNPAIMGAQQPPSSHPQFANMNMTPQAMEQMRMANGRGMPNGGSWPGQPPQMMNQGQQLQQVGTPQQRNTTMPPPPAPSQEQRTQPSSPAQPAAPPTPSQQPKAGPKGKKEGAAPKKKAPAKKNAAAATPAADTSEPPQTPTPATPITPMHAQSFNKGNGQTGNAQQNQVQAQPQPMDTAPPPFGDNLQDTNSFNLDFAVEGTDVLENFDFDSFLHNTEDTPFAGFDLMNFGNDGVEAGAD